MLGGAFGVFTAGIDTNVGFDPKDPLRTPTAREVLRDMGQRGMSYAKNFAIVGAMFSCTECIIESVSYSPMTAAALLTLLCFRLTHFYLPSTLSSKNLMKLNHVNAIICHVTFLSQHRGKSDWKNAVYSGCITGGAIGFRGRIHIITVNTPLLNLTGVAWFILYHFVFTQTKITHCKMIPWLGVELCDDLVIFVSSTLAVSEIRLK